MSIDDVWDNAVARAAQQQKTQRTFTAFKSGSVMWATGGRQTSSMQLTNKQYMDLVTAQRSAKEASAKDKKKILYLNIDDEGECSVSNTFDASTSAYCYKGGSEVPLPSVEAAPAKTTTKPKDVASNSSTKTNQSTKKVATTNAVMTTAAKKASKKNGKKAAVSVKVENKLPRGNNMSLTVSQWAKVDAKLAKDDVSFSAFSRGLVLKAIGE